MIMNNMKITDESIKRYVRESNNIIAYANMQWSGNIPWDGNIYPVTDQIISNVGRYCERYLSDCLITIDSMVKEFKNRNIENDVFIFAIRKDGVDGLGLFQSRINETPELLLHDYYRKIYAVNLVEELDEYQSTHLSVKLKDISNVLMTSLIDDSDDSSKKSNFEPEVAEFEPELEPEPERKPVLELEPTRKSEFEPTL